MNTAKINKQTFLLVLSEKKISKDYLISKVSANNPTKFIENLLDENSEIFPTINQAKEVANILRIPFASLYMTPEKITPFLHKIPKIQNRLLLDNFNDESLINLAISDVLYSYDFYLQTVELLENNLVDFNINYNEISNDKIAVANIIKNEFEISLEEQYKIKSSRQLYLYLKNKIESKGIFIQEFSGIDVVVIRAFAIYDKNFKMPIIGINSKDRPPAKCFSLIHELVHILKKNSSLCNEMYNSFQQNQEEVFCNAVAGEVLTPTNAINIILNNSSFDLTSLVDIKKIADKFSVSREVICRRLMDLGKITKTDYDTLVNVMSQQIEQEKEEEKIKRQNGMPSKTPRNMARESFDKSSIALSKILLNGYFDNVFTKRDISQILSIKPKWIDGYLQEVARWDK